MKIRLLAMAVILLSGAFSASAALITSTGTQPTKGNGNSGSPYEIWTADELRWFVHYENTRHWFPNDHAKLMADIDLSSICGPDKGSWIPLGCAEEDGAWGLFYGKFYGNGFTVSGMYIDGNDTAEIGSMAGFFGLMNAGTVSDLTVKGDIVNAIKTSYTGGMIARTGSVSTSNALTFNNCEAGVDIWINEKGGEAAKVTITGRFIGGFAGLWGKEDNPMLENCVFSGDINILDNISAYSAVGAFIGQIAICKGIDLKNCSALTTHKLPFVQYVVGSNENRIVQLNATNCVTNGHMTYKLVVNRPGDKFIYKNCLYSGQLYDVCNEDGHVEEINCIKCDDDDMYANGFACYTVNVQGGGYFFSQQLGTDKLPYPNQNHGRVYRVRKYTTCGTDNYDWTYSNTNRDITDQREHTFVDDEAYCTVCHEAVNPDYGISRDTEGYYLAAGADDVRWLWNLVNVTRKTDAKIRLIADIDMADALMAPLAEFSGIIDGQGHTLSGINIRGNDIEKVGLVGSLTGSIRNLTLAGSVIGSNASYLGAFAGVVYSYGKISNVRSDCTVKCTGTLGGEVYRYMGGIAGFSEGSLTHCVNNGPVVDLSQCTGTLKRYIGGVAGYVVTHNTVHHLFNNGVVGASGSADNGGNGAPVLNIMDAANYTESYYTTGINNPGLDYFFCNNPTATDCAVSPIDVGSGKLAREFAGKDYDTSDADTHF